MNTAENGNSGYKLRDLIAIDGEIGIIDDCPVCGVRHHIPIRTRKDIFTHKGITFSADLKGYYCASADEYFADGGMLDENMITIKTAYKKASGEK